MSSFMHLRQKYYFYFLFLLFFVKSCCLSLMETGALILSGKKVLSTIKLSIFGESLGALLIIFSSWHESFMLNESYSILTLQPETQLWLHAWLHVLYQITHQCYFVFKVPLRSNPGSPAYMFIVPYFNIITFFVEFMYASSSVLSKHS